MSCDSLHAWFKAQSRFIAMVSSLIARRWVGPRTLWRLWRWTLVGGLVPGACLWLGLPWVSLVFSLALTVCGS